MTTITIKLTDVLDTRYIHTAVYHGGYEEILYRAEFEYDDETYTTYVITEQQVTFANADSDELVSRGEKWTLVPLNLIDAPMVKNLDDCDALDEAMVQPEAYPSINLNLIFAD